jgi:hypothetical protein
MVGVPATQPTPTLPKRQNAGQRLKVGGRETDD